MNGFKKKILVSAILVSAGLGVSFNASAGGTVGGASNQMTVNAKILGVCKISTSPTLMDFGTIDPSGAANVTQTSTFAFKCTNGTTSTAPTDVGSNDIAGVKQLKHSVTATALIPYAVAYSANATGTVGAGFAAGAAATTVTVTGTITPANFNNALATTGAQIYTDVVTITVNP